MREDLLPQTVQEQHPPIPILAPPLQRSAAAVRPPTFSVVIGAYQAAATIGDAVASALEQTSPPEEVIVVDDGSTDGLQDALLPFANDVQLIHKQNGGAASARNVGVAAARGEFVAFLDADDLFLPRRLEVLGALASARPDLEILATDAVISVAGRRHSLFFEATPFAVQEQRTAIFDACFVTGWPAVRLERLRAIGGFDESLSVAHDWDCYLRLILDGATAGCVPEPYYEYRQLENSLMTDRTRALRERVDVLHKAWRRSDLTSEERMALRAALRRHETRAVTAELGPELGRGMPRGRIVRRLSSRWLTHRARMLLVVGLVAPRLARRYLPKDPGTLLRRGSA